jgi:hypothetical protein
MERMDAYSLMDTKIMDRIMKELWESDIDRAGHFMDQSTCYSLLKNPNNEIARRFYMPRANKVIKHNSYIMRVWIESVRYRYLIELGIFCLFTIGF